MTKDFVKALDDFKREMRLEMRSVKESVKFCSDTCDETKAINSELKALRQELSVLLKRNEDLKKENKQLAQRVDELEQYSRLNNLELKGVKAADNANDVIRKLGEVIDEPVCAADIDTCHKIATRVTGESNIIVRFVRRDKRQAVLAKARKRQITNQMLGLPGSDRVYVNEHLTRANKQLLGATIARKKEMSWKFVWTSGGKIFARRNESSNAVRIAGESDLCKISQ